MSEDKMAKARAAAAAARQSKTLVRLSPAEKAARNPSSLRMAITAKCFDCVGGGADANPRGAVRECSVTKCPLWPVRPWQEKEAT